MDQSQMTYSFPPLKVPEIVSCMEELGIPLSAEMLTKPTQSSMRLVYEELLELIVGISKEDLAQPSFAAMELFENPELYGDAIAETQFIRALTKLMVASGIKDFTMGDVASPTHKRTVRNLSAIINFAKFREERLARYQELTEESDALLEKEQRIIDENLALQQEIQRLRAKQEEERPVVEKLEARNAQLKIKVNQYNQQQAELQKECKAIKLQNQEATDNIASTKFAITTAKQECTKLRSQIVKSPEKLRKRIVDLETLLTEERASVSEVEGKTRVLAAKLESINLVESNVALILKALEETEAEIARHERTLADLQASRDNYTSHKENYEELCNSENILMRQVGAAQEKLDRLEKQAKTQQEEAVAMAANVEAQEKHLNSERASVEAKIAQNQAIVQQTAQKIDALKKAHAKEMSDMEVAVDNLAEEVRGYHERLFQAMAAPVSSIR